MNFSRILFLLFFTISFMAFGMEVGESEDAATNLLTPWSTLPHEIHYSYCSDLVKSKFKNYILKKLVEKNNVQQETYALSPDRKEVVFFRGSKSFSITCTRIIAAVRESADGKCVALLHGTRGSENYIEEVQIISLDSNERKTIKTRPTKCFFVGAQYFVLVKKDISHYGVRCYNLSNFNEDKPIEFECKSNMFPVPGGETLVAWCEHNNAKIVMHFYDMAQQEEISEIELPCGYEYPITMSRDGNRLALNVKRNENEIVFIIYDKHQNKWNKLLGFSAPRKKGECFFSFDPSDKNCLLVKQNENETRCYFKSATQTNRYLFRNKKLLLSDEDAKAYDCKLCKTGECGCITHGKESKKIRAVDILRLLLINHILKNNNVELSVKDTDLFKKFPDSVQSILLEHCKLYTNSAGKIASTSLEINNGQSALIPNDISIFDTLGWFQDCSKRLLEKREEADVAIGQKRAADESEEIEFRAKIARQDNFISPWLSLPSNVDLESLDVQVDLDNLAQEVEEGKMSQKINGKEEISDKELGIDEFVQEIEKSMGQE